MKISHQVATDYKSNFRTDKIAGLFDVPVEKKLTKHWEFDFPIEDKDWKIGLIIGASGSGKTTLSKHIFGKDNYHAGFKWSKSSIIESFPKNKDVRQIAASLNSVGFSSPPDWLLPYDKLSNGQKFRVEMARILLEEKPLTVIDEFTSVIDRNVAQISCKSFNKALSRNKNKIVCVTCHHDIEQWLQPDWVLDLDSLQFKWGCLRRKTLEFEVFKCHRKAWTLFKKAHYLNADISSSAQCFILMYNQTPVAFTSYINFPHPHISKCKREHRTVVLPDFQGIGIGNKLSAWLGHYLDEKGYSFISTTSHPSFIFARNKNKNWKLTRKLSMIDAKCETDIRKIKNMSFGRLTASFKFIPDRMIK